MPRNPRSPVGRSLVNIPSLTGKVPYDVERAIEIIREQLERGLIFGEDLAARIAAMPPPLTLDQIRSGLAATGGVPMATAGLLNTETPPTSPPGVPGNPSGAVIMNVYTDICRDGTQVQCNAIEGHGAPTIQFGSDAPITLPGGNGLFLSAASAGGGHFAIVKSQADSMYRVDRSGTVTLLGPSSGNYNGLINKDDGVSYWMDNPSTHYRFGNTPPGTQVAVPSAFSGTSQGFLFFDGADPVFVDDSFQNPGSYTFNDVRFFLPSRDGDWWVGQHPTQDLYVAYNISSGILYNAGPSLGSPIAPRVAQHADGSCTLARSLPGGFLHSSTFREFGVQSPDSIDLSTVIWTQTDVSGWAQTAVLSAVEFSGSNVCLRYDRNDGPSAWPVDFENCQGNPWVFFYIENNWYGSTYEYFTLGQECKPLADVVPNTARPMRFHTPVSGENVGWMVSGRARDSMRTVLERTNVLVAPWP